MFNFRKFFARRRSVAPAAEPVVEPMTSPAQPEESKEPKFLLPETVEEWRRVRKEGEEKIAVIADSITAEADERVANSE